MTSTSVITLKVSATSVTRNKSVEFSGSVSTSTPGKVTLKVKTSGGSWKTAKTVSLRGAGSNSVSIKMTKKGTFYYKAVFPTSATQLGGSSGQVKAKVKEDRLRPLGRNHTANHG